MDLGIRGKVAVVAAASRGLGRGVAEALAAEGVDLAICARNEDSLNETAEYIRGVYGVEVLPVVCDVTDRAGVESLRDRVIERFGTCHIVFTNAGGPPAGRLEDFSSEDFRKAIDLHLVSTIDLVYAFLPYMKEQRWGRVLASTSSNVRQLLSAYPLSNVSRNATAVFIRTFAAEFARFHITANVLAPGLFLTGPTKAYLETRAKREGVSYEEALEREAMTIPTRTIGDPEDYGALAAFLASEQAAFITGETILIDGGAYGTAV